LNIGPKLLGAASPCTGAEAGGSRAAELADAIGAIIELNFRPQAVPEAPTEPGNPRAAKIGAEIQIGCAQAGGQAGIEIAAEVLDRLAALQIQAAAQADIRAYNRISERGVLRLAGNRQSDGRCCSHDDPQPRPFPRVRRHGKFPFVGMLQPECAECCAATMQFRQIQLHEGPLWQRCISDRVPTTPCAGDHRPAVQF